MILKTLNFVQLTSKFEKHILKFIFRSPKASLAKSTVSSDLVSSSLVVGLTCLKMFFLCSYSSCRGYVPENSNSTVAPYWRKNCTGKENWEKAGKSDSHCPYWVSAGTGTEKPFISNFNWKSYIFCVEDLILVFKSGRFVSLQSQLQSVQRFNKTYVKLNRRGMQTSTAICWFVICQ